MDYRERFIVEPGRKVRLEKIDPSYTGKHESLSLIHISEPTRPY